MRSFHDTLTLPNGVVLKNRLAIAPLTVCLSDPHGYVTPQEVDYCASRTGEVGLYITGCSYIQPNGRGWLGEEAIYDDSFIPGLSKMASAIKRNGTKAIMQIFHAGRMAEEDAIFGYDLVSAGDVAAPLKGYRTPRPLTDAEIAEVIANFKGAAVRAMKAGFDGVEIHGANNYLIHQFFSPHSNNRTDCWGGSLENRAAFPLAVADAVLDAVREMGAKDFIVGYRLSPREQWTPGIALGDTLYLVDKLASLKLDYLHISQSHITSTVTEPEYCGKPILAHIDETVRGRLPIISVGNIQTRSDVQQALEHSDIAAVGGSALIDPNWAAKLLNGHDEAIRTKLAPEDREILKISPLAFKILSSRAPERIL